MWVLVTVFLQDLVFFVLRTDSLLPINIPFVFINVNLIITYVLPPNSVKLFSDWQRPHQGFFVVFCI